MAGTERLDDSIARWLEASAPDRLPQRVLAATFERTRRARQDPAWHTGFGRLQPRRLVPAWAGVAVVLTVVVLALGIGVILGVGGRPSPSPTATTSTTNSPRPPAPSVGAEVTGLLNGFLHARVAGAGAQQYLSGSEEAIPLLYATTSGAAYERAEFEPVVGYEWPYDLTAYEVRLFAGATVVEQLVFAQSVGSLGLEYRQDAFGTDIAPTTEDARPIAAPYDAFAGEVTLHIAHPWVAYGGRDSAPIKLIPNGTRVRPTTDGGERSTWYRLVLLADPGRIGTGCPVGPDPSNANALAESIRADPGLEATVPVAVGAGGVAGLMMDVRVAAGASGACWTISGGSQSQLMDSVSLATGGRMRLYLFDAPTGSSMRVLGIAFAVPEADFERAAAAASSLAVEFSRK